MPGEQLREHVCEANRLLHAAGLVVLSFGNASGVDRALGLMAIKPSGVGYDVLAPVDIVLVSLETGLPLEGSKRPSSDTPTHLELYRRFPTIGGVVHTHSAFATSWAQARREIPCLGTTHADHFRGAVPVTRLLTDTEIASDYERNTGLVIVERLVGAGLSADDIAGVLVAHHGPFVWGSSPAAALDAAIALEHVAEIATHQVALDRRLDPIPPALLARHFTRKHGADAYYGQPAPADGLAEGTGDGC
jgi:L-ribulose-5-phosphate 4-epimerase